MAIKLKKPLQRELKIKASLVDYSRS